MLTRKSVVSPSAISAFALPHHAARLVTALSGLGLALILTGCSSPEPKKARIDPQTGTLRVHPALAPAAAAAVPSSAAAGGNVTATPLPVATPTVEQGSLPALPPAVVPPAPAEPQPPAVPGKKPRRK